MAPIPKSGRRVQAPGPSGVWPGGPIYERGLAAWSEATQHVAGVLREKSERIENARETSELVKRAADFSLGMEQLHQQVGQIPDAMARREAYRTGSESLRQKVLDWAEGSPEAKTRLDNHLTEAWTRDQVRFMHEEEGRTVKQIADYTQAVKDRALQTGDEGMYRWALGEAERAGIISPAKRQEEEQTFRVDSELAGIVVEITKPNGNLDRAEQSINEVLADTSITQAQRSRASQLLNFAQAEKADRKQQSAELSDQVLERVLAKARTQDLATTRTAIAQSDGLTEQQKIMAMKAVTTAVQLWEKDGVNPWENTRNYGSLIETINDIEQKTGKIKTKNDILERVAPNGEFEWSFNHWRMANRLFDDINKPSDTGFSRGHPLAKLYFDKLDRLYGKDGVIPKKREKEYVDKYLALEKAFSDPKVWGNATEMEASYQGLVKEVKEAQARSFVYPQGGWFPMPELPREPRQIESHEAADSLPKGTLYRLPDDPNTYRKL